jgi:hypothetical protein
LKFQGKGRSRINRLAFKRQHCEHALMDPLQRFTSDEELQRLGTEGEEEGAGTEIGWLWTSGPPPFPCCLINPQD